MNNSTEQKSSNNGRMILIIVGVVGGIVLLTMGCCICGPVMTALLVPDDASIADGTPPAPDEPPVAKPDDEPKPRDQKLTRFLDTVAVVDREGPIEDVSAHEILDSWKLTITVGDAWKSMAYNDRLEYATTYRGAWKGVVAPKLSTISIRDASGTEIGGSGAYSESAIWVEE